MREVGTVHWHLSTSLFILQGVDVSCRRAAAVSCGKLWRNLLRRSPWDLGDDSAPDAAASG